ncbi:MOSC domain-containing protein [Litoribrevibacter euphylliae]|uniref:MOSC domain-containing protein n=1 Tax=Litoribrevibacter euphylliae TaxID=1834034 RepID=A0ABV7HK26_9GAMM
MDKQSLSTTISHVFVGKVRAFGPKEQTSAINKTLVLGAVKVHSLGLEGDEQADLRVHGGVEKAIHYYPAEHYQKLQETFPHIEFNAGSFGENLSSVGITEKEVCLGDIFQLGSAKVQLSQGRQPCWKLNHKFGEKTMAKTVQSLGVIGWYYRVLEDGVVKAGDSLTLLERPCPEANLDRIFNVLHRDTLNFDELEALAPLEIIPENWRRTFEKRLAKREVEDSSKRLEGPLNS